MQQKKKRVPVSKFWGCTVSPNVFYECVICGKIIPSVPEHSMGCDCRNIQIDVDAGRLHIGDDDSVFVFKEVDVKEGPIKRVIDFFSKDKK